MTIVYKRATREGVQMLIGLAGGTGSGKTLSAMRIAKGMSGGNPFAVIDTENGRARHYADHFLFDTAELRAPFRPEAYVDAIMSADKSGYPVIVVDSMSHVWAGDGGLLEWHDEIVEGIVERKRKFAESKGWQFDEHKTREASSVAGWIEPKTSHKKMVSKLLQVRAHVILCFRAEPKIEIGKDEKGKTQIRPMQSIVGLDGWMPVCEKNLPYELTASFLLTAQEPGVLKPIKLQLQHKPFFPLDKQVGESTGAKIAEWARGKPAEAQAHKQAPADPVSPPAETKAATAAPAPPAADAPVNDEWTKTYDKSPDASEM